MSGIGLALAIGNSRLHWAKFWGDTLQATWDTSHWNDNSDPHDQELKNLLEQNVPLMIASVVPEQSQRWTTRPNVRFLSLQDIPLQGMYSTLGVDRALAAWGAVQTVGGPVLVIDAGTALTFTGVDGDCTLIGGAILPGLRLQFEALGQKTAALPIVSTNCEDFPSLPIRWARQTEEAIASGILHTVVAGVQDFIEAWQQQFPGSAVVMTGGDSDRLYHCLQEQHSSFFQQITLSPHLIFQGMISLRFC